MTAAALGVGAELGLEVRRVDLRRPAEWVEAAARTLLEPEEARRRQREPDEVWRRRVVARAALRIALSGRVGGDPAALRFSRGPNGKPALASGPHFNLAHSGDVCVVAICDAAAVGVDVEQVRERAHLERLVRTRLASSEAEEILGLDGAERQRAFYRVWTRKEAYLKATGAGLTAELAAFAVSAGERPALLTPLRGDRSAWTLLDLALGESIQGALAVAAPVRDAEVSLRPAELPMESQGEWETTP